MKYIKENIYNESILRKALINWRNKIIPIIYLDKLYKIKLGYKIFKLGLKKLHERQIYDNIDAFAKYSRKIWLLKYIVKNLELKKNYEYIYYCFNKWNNISEIQKMKEKIYLLFKTYILTYKINERLFQSQKDDIINILKK